MQTWNVIAMSKNMKKGHINPQPSAYIRLYEGSVFRFHRDFMFACYTLFTDPE